jgi:hypothetical protein
VTRRPMRRLSDLLPDLAARLGIEAELREASRAQTWDLLVAELVPPAAGRCHVLETRPPTLVVSAPDAATAQELRLQASVLLDAFSALPSGAGVTELKVVVRAA